MLIIDIIKNIFKIDKYKNYDLPTKSEDISVIKTKIHAGSVSAFVSVERTSPKLGRSKAMFRRKGVKYLTLTTNKNKVIKINIDVLKKMEINLFLGVIFINQAFDFDLRHPSKDLLADAEIPILDISPAHFEFIKNLIEYTVIPKNGISDNEWFLSENGAVKLKEMRK